METIVYPGICDYCQQVQPTQYDIPFMPFQHPDKNLSVSLYW
jgi:hypothetical protein